MAAIGDSITQAANTDRRKIGSSNPEHSWSTGSDREDRIVSHYERLLAGNRRMRNNNFNAAVSGARIDDAPAQAETAVAWRAQYVTFEMGGNDLCTSDRSTMTAVATYESHFRRTLNTLVSGLPSVRVYALSVPDVYRLWELFKDDARARLIWNGFNVCQSMLDRSNTEADRQFVRQRNIDFNRVLERVCDEFEQCRFDEFAVFEHRFSRSDVSSVDFFHPSLQGQATLAQTSWAAGYWPTVS